MWLFDEHGTEWMEQGACTKADPSLFFPSRGKTTLRNTREARSICNDCPVLYDCLQYALSLPMDEDWGIWGQTTREDRSRFRNYLRRKGLSWKDMDSQRLRNHAIAFGLMS